MKLTLIYLILFSAFVGCNDVNNTIKETANEDENLNISQEKAEDPIKAKNKQSNQDDWYWKNTTMSNDNVFENWEEGSVALVMTYRLKQNDTQPRTVKVGSIDADGSIIIELPSEIKTETTLDKLGNLVFYDVQDISNLKYENGDTGFFSNTTFQVQKNGAVIGVMTMGNSVRTTYNLVNQSTLTMGDEGYLVYLVYVDGDSAMLGAETRTDKVRRDGTNTIEAETTVVYNLDFKSGWNFVKTEVIGSYNLKHERGLNASWFKKHEHSVVPEMPNEASYFFRKLGN